MNTAPRLSENLMDQLPTVRGRLRENMALNKVTWFQVGGPADVMFKPADVDDLQHFLRELDPSVARLVLGVGSNLLVRDGGYRGVVIRLGREFAKMEILAGNQVRVGAGSLDGNVARFVAEAALTGAEFLSGIPGSIGGALRMNAGAYGAEICDILVSATALDRNGVKHSLTAEDMGFSYRHSDIPSDWIFTEAVFQLADGNSDDIAVKMKDIAQSREDSQPIRSRTGGSTFANPDGKKAWELIDAVGARGLKVGGAQISEKHCNFLLNTGDATAADLETVGEEARRRVFQEHDTLLRWEIVRVGEPLSDGKGGAQ
jgi:UDP-N-acetylmuramate dehydrogenase